MSYKKEVGQFGENLACDFLQGKGYKIIGRNVKVSFQEIDIISQRGDLIVFVEVKTRTGNSFGEGELAVDSYKINNLKKAMENYSYANSFDLENVRLDLIVVDIDKSVKIANIKHYFGII